MGKSSFIAIFSCEIVNSKMKIRVAIIIALILQIRELRIEFK